MRRACTTAAWHIELRPGPTTGPPPLLALARGWARHAGTTGLVVGRAEPLEGGPRSSAIRRLDLVDADQLSETPPVDGWCRGTVVGGSPAAFGLAHPVDDPWTVTHVWWVDASLRGMGDLDTVQASDVVPGLSLIAPADGASFVPGLYRIGVQGRAGERTYAVCVGLCRLRPADEFRRRSRPGRIPPVNSDRAGGGVDPLGVGVVLVVAALVLAVVKPWDTREPGVAAGPSAPPTTAASREPSTSPSGYPTYDLGPPTWADVAPVITRRPAWGIRTIVVGQTPSPDVGDPTPLSDRYAERWYEAREGTGNDSYRLHRWPRRRDRRARGHLPTR